MRDEGEAWYCVVKDSLRAVGEKPRFLPHGDFLKAPVVARAAVRRILWESGKPVLLLLKSG